MTFLIAQEGIVDSGTSEMTMPSWAIKKVIGKMPLKNNPMVCKN
jgi:hypothetical protein